MMLVDQLADKLPPDLRRRLLIISMKIYPGYCQPRIIKDFEDSVNALPEPEPMNFETEWKRLREPPEWPDTSRLRQSMPAKKASGRSGAGNQ